MNLQKSEIDLVAGRRHFKVLILSCSLLLAAPVLAATPSTTANGNTGANVTAAPADRPIKKFTTDEPLRKGMSQIAALLNAAWPDIQASRLQTPAYQELARQVTRQTEEIVRNCKLDARTDQAFHGILTDVNQAVLLLQRDKAPIQRTGALALAQALRNYARYFDHPGWTGPQP